MLSPPTLFTPETDVEEFALECLSESDPAKEVVRVTPGFKGTVAAQKQYKIYVALNQAGVQYVGCTCTALSTRLSMGNRTRTKSSKGYHGYKWLSLAGLRLVVFHLTGIRHPAPDVATREHNKQVAERIEAELVFAVRAATGQWPLSQHEIHFHNLALQAPLAQLTTTVARQMYTRLGLRQPLAAIQ